jgi:hypothetical protein
LASVRDDDEKLRDVGDGDGGIQRNGGDYVDLMSWDVHVGVARMAHVDAGVDMIVALPHLLLIVAIHVPFLVTVSFSLVTLPLPSLPLFGRHLYP